MTDRSVNVYNLPPQVNDDQLKAEFERCGDINLTRVWRALSTGNSLGMGFIQFASPDSVEKALGITKEIAGQLIRVTRVSPMRPKALDYGPATTEHEPTKTIFVGRLAHDVDSAQLRREFERFGKIVSARVQRHHDSGKSRGFGYIDFASTDSVELAVKHDWTFKINGFSVKVARNYRSPGPRHDVVPFVDANDPYDSFFRTGSWEDDY
ncbi:RNA-binding domain-containing protein [Peniophora sp. CONT]|nr:RNA-binding domain-containing protein [Peniophora sp. CONT]